MTGWTAVLPVKPWHLAKSRLAGSRVLRSRLARAFTLDVLDTLQQSSRIERIIVVSADAGVAAWATQAGVDFVVDGPSGSRDPLNQAVDRAREHALAHYPEDRIVVVPGDLAGMTVGALDEALDEMALSRRSFIRDATGVGTTLVTAMRPAWLVTSYGPGSGGAHVNLGLTEATGVASSTRHDIDTWKDLLEAASEPLGRRTRAVLSSMGLCPTVEPSLLR